MRNPFLNITVNILCAASLLSPTLATADYSSSGSAPPSTTYGGYSSSVSQQSVAAPGYNSSTSAPPSTTTHQHQNRNRFTLSLNIPGTNTVVTYHRPKHRNKHQQQPFWIAMQPGEPVPTNAVIGGNQYNPNAMFYVCRANYRGGMHPGKYFRGNCNISWGGREVVLQNFEMLISPKTLHWVSTNAGAIPHHAIPGGNENNQTLYICQADYENGTHTGKVIGRNCNFGWGGKEIITPNYSVLVG